MRTTKAWIILFAVISPLILHSQISITNTDLLGLIGTTLTMEEDSSGTVEVDHGAPGADQTWDLSNVALTNPFTLNLEFLAPSTTPYAANFSEANLAQKITSPDFMDGAIYTYFQIEADGGRSIGSASVFTTMGMTFENIDEDDELFAPLPINFNSTWSETIRDTTTDQTGLFTLISFDSTVITVDGWGKLKLPHGEFECLRLYEQCWNRTQSIVQGVPTGMSSESALSYIWVSKNNWILATVTSQDGETDPNFTSSSSFGRLAGGSSPALDLQDLSQNLQLKGPNPFSDQLAIDLTMDHGTNVSLDILDVQGRLVKQLWQVDQIRNIQHLTWNGTGAGGQKVPSGTYLLSLKSDQGRAIRKIQFLR